MNKDVKNYLSEGVVIAVFSLMSYVTAYQYESGFCSYWQIPNYLISISLTSAIAAGLSLFFFILVIFYIINLPLSFLDKAISKKGSMQQKTVLFNLLALFILIALFLGYGFSFIPLVYTGMVLFLEIIHLILPWCMDKRKNPGTTPFFERIKRSNDGKYELRDGFFWMRELLGAKLFWVLIIAITVMILFVPTAGTASAKLHKNYLVVEKYSLILIKRFGENYILRKIDLSNNSVSGELLLWQSDDISKVKLLPKYLENINVIKKS